jgi:hypothetical protein
MGERTRPGIFVKGPFNLGQVLQTIQSLLAKIAYRQPSLGQSLPAPA